MDGSYKSRGSILEFILRDYALAGYTVDGLGLEWVKWDVENELIP